MNNLKHQGFSLVEIVLALGIISIALVSILGLVATSLNTSKNSKDDNALALMTQSAVTELRKTDYATRTGNGSFANLTSIDYFFDGSGTMIRDANGVPATTSTPAKALYSCTISVDKPTNWAVDSQGQSITAFPTGMAFLKLEFAWPYQAATQQHKIIFTSLAKYDDF